MRFYDDLLGDKIVVLDMMYADCTGVCPTITSNRVKAQKLLEARGARRFFHSIKIKPEEDTPETLHEYADMHGVRGRWLFLTGRPGDVELLRHTLGHVDIIPAVDREKGRHSGIIVYGNEPQSLWGACQGSATPEWIAEEISFVVPQRHG